MKHLFGLVLAVLMSANCCAGIVLSLGNQTFTEGTGFQTFNVTATAAPNLSVNDLTVDFLSDFNFTSTPITGVFGQVGMLGAGNTTGSSSFALGTPINSLGTLNLQFNSAQLLSSTPVVVGAFQVNTNTIALGTYGISIASASSSPGPGAGGFTFQNGSFTVTAVPEPSSMVLMGLSVAGFGAYARFRKGKKKAVAA